MALLVALALKLALARRQLEKIRNQLEPDQVVLALLLVALVLTLALARRQSEKIRK